MPTACARSSACKHTARLTALHWQLLLPCLPAYNLPTPCWQHACAAFCLPLCHGFLPCCFTLLHYPSLPTLACARTCPAWHFPLHYLKRCLPLPYYLPAQHFQAACSTATTLYAMLLDSLHSSAGSWLVGSGRTPCGGRHPLRHFDTFAHWIPPSVSGGGLGLFFLGFFLYKTRHSPHSSLSKSMPGIQAALLIFWNKTGGPTAKRREGMRLQNIGAWQAGGGGGRRWCLRGQHGMWHAMRWWWRPLPLEQWWCGGQTCGSFLLLLVVLLPASLPNTLLSRFQTFCNYMAARWTLHMASDLLLPAKKAWVRSAFADMTVSLAWAAFCITMTLFCHRAACG